MEQSTKLFLVLGFMFLIYTVLNGHFEKYLKIIFGSSNSGSGGIGNIISKVGDVAKTATKVASVVGVA